MACDMLNKMSLAFFGVIRSLAKILLTCPAIVECLAISLTCRSNTAAGLGGGGGGGGVWARKKCGKMEDLACKGVI